VVVRPLTRLSVGELAAAGAGDTVELRLRAGRIRGEVRPPGGGTRRRAEYRLYGEEPHGDGVGAGYGL
jgi:hypothetical protein